jgi:broad specificity phosphatase PhoE
VATTILLVRHGETDWNRERRFQGQADIPLNETGREQARRLAETFGGEPFSAVYTSPLLRARETAEIIALPRGLPVEPEEALLEIDVGSWAGLTTADVEARFAEGYRVWKEWRSGWENGESYDELGRRVVAGLVRIAAEHPDGTVLAVTHGGPIRSAVAAANGIPYTSVRSAIGEIENGAVVRIAVRDGRIERVD